MKSIDENLKKRDVKGLFKHPRLKMLDEFHARINAERRPQGMKPLPMSAVAVKTSHLPLDDLGYLLKKCQQSSNFSRTFFGLLKIKPLDTTQDKQHGKN